MTLDSDHSSAGEKRKQDQIASSEASEVDGSSAGVATEGVDAAVPTVSGEKTSGSGDFVGGEEASHPKFSSHHELRVSPMVAAQRQAKAAQQRSRSSPYSK